MMRETKALALFILVGFAFMVLPGVSKAEQNQLYANIEAKRAVTDTLPVISDDLNAGISPQNLVFKKRLDSIQKSVPLTYNQYVQQYIDIYMSRQKQIGKMLGLSNYYFPIYEKALKENNVPDEVKFLSIVESYLDPNAVSRVGAIGLWQFMYTTALGYNLKIDNYTDERKDPVASSYAAAHYLKNAYDEFGDWLLAIASYNCGESNVERAIRKAGGIRDFWAIREYLPRETRNYVPAYIAVTYVMQYSKAHNIETISSDMPEITDVIQVNKVVSLATIATALEMDVKKLSLLNPSYKKQIINGTVESPKSLVVPVLSKESYEGLYTALNPVKDEPQLIFASTRNISKPLKRSSPTYYKVKKGENLSIIANRYRVEVQDLKVWNKLKTMMVWPGQLLKVSSGRDI